MNTMQLKGNFEHIMDWLMKGNVAIQYQTNRDIMIAKPRELLELQKKFLLKVGERDFLSCRKKKNGHWGITFYQPKWTSTHYTLLDLRIIGLEAANKLASHMTHE
jgi:hypothetical protein